MLRSIISGMAGCALALLASCQTTALNPYPGIETRKLTSGTLYVTPSDHPTLLIFIEGSGMNSVLGLKNGVLWDSVGFAYYVYNHYRGDFDIAIPEKLDYSFGEDYQNDLERMPRYTVDGLVSSYAAALDDFLSSKNYDTVILFGISEGGLLLPRILNNLRYKGSVTKMVVWGAGGYSQEECFRILGGSAIPMPQGYREECLKIDTVLEEVAKDPYSLTKGYLGWPYNRWSSFFPYQPIQEYKAINVPVLFVQGKRDYSSPVESVQFLQVYRGDRQYSAKYYDMGHIPEEDTETIRILDEIAAWIRE
ncbi:MAG: hypothetical protein JW765_00065 [Deltaproteobacteria bacterium]|nr:hypothetical protein [Candidatus Zymogenaceae bacterium]